MVSSLPTGTVSSGRDDPAAPGDPPGSRRQRETPAEVVELQRENETLRAAVEKQRRENDRIVEQYERLLEHEQQRREVAEADAGAGADGRNRADDGLLARLADAVGLR
ncbi:MAG: hypothetical protein ABEJ82_00140 [Haloplanus sp.]